MSVNSTWYITQTAESRVKNKRRLKFVFGVSFFTWHLVCRFQLHGDSSKPGVGGKYALRLCYRRSIENSQCLLAGARSCHHWLRFRLALSISISMLCSDVLSYVYLSNVPYCTLSNAADMPTTVPETLSTAVSTFQLFAMFSCSLVNLIWFTFVFIFYCSSSFL